MWTRRVFLAGASAALFGQDAPPAAESILEKARAEANGRAIWVLFHASW